MNELCESCGQPGYVVLEDDSVWCLPCDSAARNMGYDDAKIVWFAGQRVEGMGT